MVDQGDPEYAGEQLILADLISRVLDRGVQVRGEVVISVAGIDLVELGLDLRLISSETAHRRHAMARSASAAVEAASADSAEAAGAERTGEAESPGRPGETRDDDAGS